MLLVPVDSGHSLDSVLPRLAGYRVDAIVSALAVLSPATAAALAKLRIPVISFNTKVSNAWVTSVSTDNARAGAEIADHFLARGARSFGFITGPLDSPASAERLKGFRRTLARRGFKNLRIAGGNFRYEDGFQAALAMFARVDAPELIFCANDLLAIGAIDAIRTRLRLRVPEDVLVAGFNDIPMAGWAGYELTTFVQDVSLMVREMIKMFQHSPIGRRDLAEGRVTLPAVWSNACRHRGFVAGLWLRLPTCRAPKVPDCVFRRLLFRPGFLSHLRSLRLSVSSSLLAATMTQKSSLGENPALSQRR